MRFWLLCLLLILSSEPSCILRKDRIVKQRITYEGRNRSYYLYAPDNLDSSKPVPLLIALHGVGGGLDGSELVENWKKLANKIGIVVVGPSAIGAWTSENPDFLRFLVESVKTRFSVDSHRVYLAGFSGGGCAALAIALRQSRYFAAVAVYSGIILPKQTTSFRLNDGRTPIAIWAFDNDYRIPKKQLDYSVDFLRKYGFQVQISIVPGSGHLGMENQEINAAVWAFLKSNARDGGPQWINYRTPNR